MDKDWCGISTSKSLNLERKTVVDNPTPEMINTMVKNAVKCIKKTNGASAEDVCKYIESKYDTKVLRSRIDEALNEGVNIGTYQKLNDRYFIQEKTSRKRDFENMNKNCPDPEFKNSSIPESLNPDSKADIEVTTPGIVNIMVKNAIKFSKTPKGTSLEGICKYIEDNYDVNVSRNCVNEVLREGIRVGTFEKRNEHYFAEKGTFRRKDNEDIDIGFPDPKLNIASTSRSLNPQSKADVIIPTPGMVKTMVKNAVKHLKKRSGTSLEEVYTYIEDNYEVKVSKNNVNEALREGVSNGTFEKINGEYFLEKENSRRKVFVEERFKLLEEKPSSLEKEPRTQTLTREMLVMMVKYSIKNLKKAKGASLIDIRSYMEEHYGVNMKFSELSVSQILNDMVNLGVLIKITGANEIDRFKFKEEERK